MLSSAFLTRLLEFISTLYLLELFAFKKDQSLKINEVLMVRYWRFGWSLRADLGDLGILYLSTS
jgi:hypothetical protein